MTVCSDSLPHPLLVSVLNDPKAVLSLSADQWNLLLRQARHAGVMAKISIMILKLEQQISWSVPEAPRRHLISACQLAAKQLRTVQWEVNRLSQALRHLDIPVILLKGTAYAVAELPASRGRLFNDIDIMVPKSRLAEVEKQLMLHGWVASHHDSYDQRYYRTWMHELPPMVHVKRETVLDVHHNILPETAWLRLDPTVLFEAAQPLANRDPFAVLSPEDMVLHSATHLFSDGDFEHGLRDLADLNDLIVCFSTGHSQFWDQLLNRAEQLRLTRPLYYALSYICFYFSRSLPDNVLDKLNGYRPAYPIRSLMHWLLVRALRPKHPSCDLRYTALARWLLYIRSHYLRMPLYLLLPHLIRKALKPVKSIKQDDFRTAQQNLRLDHIDHRLG